MKDEAKSLLTLKGTLKSIARVADYIEGLIEDGATGLEERIIESKKTISDCWQYICRKAKEQATDGSACIEDEEVYGWAVHYFEELGHPDGYDVPKPAKTPAKTAKEDPKKGKGKKTKAEAVQAEIEIPKSEDVKESAKNESIVTMAENAAPADTDKTPGLPDGFIKITDDEDDVFAEEQIPGQIELTAEELITPDAEPAAEEEPATSEEEPASQTPAEDPVILPPEEVLGENRCCAVCGKKMVDAFAGTPVETIRKWTESWMRNYGEVFCCKEHMTEFLSKKEAAV